MRSADVEHNMTEDELAMIEGSSHSLKKQRHQSSSRDGGSQHATRLDGSRVGLKVIVPCRPWSQGEKQVQVGDVH